MPPTPAPLGDHEIDCPHCRKRFRAELIPGRAARYAGFKCTHCKLFVPVDRAGLEAGYGAPVDRGGLAGGDGAPVDRHEVVAGDGAPGSDDGLVAGEEASGSDDGLDRPAVAAPGESS